ncbi:outer membrane beta-barrel protein [Salmonella enterica]|nr:outer membrane beta-barrel protein [Salmonella enterica]EDR7524773.1 Ail/Lom family outer membrane beta-barrel protein [Salmonella enterica subsp. enterica serovar Oranienburg]EIM5532815.1 Ail/Lom family outer membrane beta-barrel protein [Salmonella enterica subsp. enterica]
MKKLAVVIITGLMCGSMGFANASDLLQNTASVGYAFSHINDYGNLNGINLSYRYEFTPEWGILGSFTWATASKSERSGSVDEGLYKYDSKLNYYSLLAGPVYRINDFVSLYGQIGVGYIKAHGSESDTYRNSYDKDNFSLSKTGFAYGAGVQFNPVKNLALTAGYEGATFSSVDDSGSINPNGFNVSVGYRF